VVALALFITGIVLRRGACDPLKNPDSDQLIVDYLDKLLDLNLIFYPPNKQAKSKSTGKTPEITNQQQREPFRISHIVKACHQNESIYNVLKFENLFNISLIENYPKEFGIIEQLNELAKSLKIDQQFEILDDTTKREILQLSKSQLNIFDSDKFTDNLASEITKYNLKDLANRLRDTSNKIQSASMNDIKVSLKNQALILSTFQSNLVEPMTKGTEELIRLSTSLAKDLRFGESSFERAIQNFLREIQDAEQYIKVNGTEFVQATAKVLLEGFTSDITAYLKLVVNQTRNDVGKCGPISNVYDSMIVATCNRVVDPFVSSSYN
jgi:prominin 1